jgi:serine/threonine protein phosphatase PrpC
MSCEGCGFPNFFSSIAPIDEEDVYCQKIATVALFTLGLIGMALVASGVAGWGGMHEWWDAGILAEMGTVCSLTIAGIGGIVIIGDIATILCVNLGYKGITQEEPKQAKKHNGINLDDNKPIKIPEDNDTMGKRLSRAIEEGEKNTKELKGKWDGVEFINDSSLDERIRQMREEGLKFMAAPNFGAATLPNTKGDGKRPVEDCFASKTFTLEDGTKVNIYGVFDGHGDKGYWSTQMSRYVCEELPNRLNQLPDRSPATIEAMLKQLSLDCQEDRKGAPSSPVAGTTAVYALQIGDLTYIANVGDSRAVLVNCVIPYSYQLTEDAEIKNKRFRNAVEDLGLPFSEWNNRVSLPSGQNINVANDIGIKELPTLTEVTYISNGEYTSYEKEKDLLYYQAGNYLILATDGFTDACSNSELSLTVQKLDKLGKHPSEIARHLASSARLVEGSLDDITVLVVKL